MLQRIDHVAFTVSDIQRAADFFTRVLSFSEEGRWSSDREGSREVRFLTLGSSVVELILGEEHGAAAVTGASMPGFRHLCLRSDDLDTDMIQLAGAGAKFIGTEMRVDDRLFNEMRPVAGYSLEKGLRRIMVEGPDNIVVEIMERGE